MPSGAELGDTSRIHMDDWELCDEVQNKIKELWPQITDENIFELNYYQDYKDESLKLFGFGLDSIDYEADVDTLINFDPVKL